MIQRLVSGNTTARKELWNRISDTTQPDYELSSHDQDDLHLSEEKKNDDQDEGD